MTLTTRDRWIVALLPAVLVLGAYVWFWSAPEGKRRAALQIQVAETSEEVPLPQALNDLRVRVRHMEEALGKGKKEAPGAAALTSRDGQAEAYLTEALSRSGLRLLKREAIPGTAAERQLDESSRRLARSMKQSGQQNDLHLVSLKMQGAYSNAERFFQSLSQAPCWIVPVKVEMTAGDESGEASWSLLLWL